ncbi:hypothetical protein BD413DRAFT_640441 [Trametes elegans]|nr:hypothetical protein BD413DRAFT_640441 [Trametes elegans]
MVIITSTKAPFERSALHPGPFAYISTPSNSVLVLAGERRIGSIPHRTLPQHPDVDHPPPKASFHGLSIQPSSSLTHCSLIPLSFAQRRRDIRHRREGFETGGPPTPFAVRTHTLLPLDVAYAREDIRRREEAFELRVVAHALAADPDARGDGCSRGAAVALAHPPPPSTPRMLSCSGSRLGLQASPSSPSVYSPDGEEATSPVVLEPSWSFDSLVAVYTNRSCYGDDDLDDSGGERSCSHVAVSGSAVSFDEDSFMRMAERDLGW